MKNPELTFSYEVVLKRGKYRLFKHITLCPHVFDGFGKGTTKVGNSVSSYLCLGWLSLEYGWDKRPKV